MLSWVEIFVVLVCSHLAGDFLLQTEFQALNKFAALGGGGSLRALGFHTLTYAAAYVPIAAIVADERGGGTALALMLLVALPHFLQDDGRLVRLYVRTVKHSQVEPGELLFLAVDQSLHVLALLAAALLVAA